MQMLAQLASVAVKNCDSDCRENSIEHVEGTSVSFASIEVGSCQSYLNKNPELDKGSQAPQQFIFEFRHPDSYQRPRANCSISYHEHPACKQVKLAEHQRLNSFGPRVGARTSSGSARRCDRR